MGESVIDLSEYLTVKEFATQMSRTKHAITHQLRRGNFKNFFTRGGIFWIHRSELDNYRINFKRRKKSK